MGVAELAPPHLEIDAVGRSLLPGSGRRLLNGMNEGDQSLAFSEEFRGPFSVRVRIGGFWREVDRVGNLYEALGIASMHSGLAGENNVQITDADMKLVA